MKLDRRRTVRRSDNRIHSQSSYHKEEINRRSGIDRRLKTRNPIYIWYQSNRKEFPLYIFILITCIVIAVLSNFKDVVHRSLYRKNTTYSSNPSENKEILASRKTEENRKLLERNQLGSESW